MKCHYEVLGVARDVNEEDLKKAYRKLALRWHPDKNLDNVEEAKEQFQQVQQAYEVLGDPHERAFYDKHREAIIRGGHDGEYKDNSLDVFPYFSTSCFKGYGDDDKGFYAVYREVFNKIAGEDVEFRDGGDSDLEVPTFGDSTSSYEEVVHPFYGYWQSYSTKKSYAWLDPYDIREAPNRRVVRMIEKENKKIREKARKERNEEVRNLVSFVRKRDKRVQAHIKILEERAALNAKKAEEKRKQQLLEKQAALKDYKESEWSKFSNVEHELKEIEARMAAEFGVSDEDTVSEDDEEQVDEAQWVASTLYCIACKKLFKTEKAFVNHENSKKHKENVELLKEQVLDDEEEIKSRDSPSHNGVGSGNDKTKDDQDSDVEEEPEAADLVKTKKKKKKRKSRIVVSTVNSEDSDSNIDMLSPQSRKQRRKQQRQNSIQEVPPDTADTSPLADGDLSDSEDEDQDPKKKDKKTKPAQKTHEEANSTTEADKVKTKGWKAKEVRRKARKDAEAAGNVKDLNLCCVICHSEFPSKNKLFDHLKKTGHSVYLPKSTLESKIEEKEKARKSRKK